MIAREEWDFRTVRDEEVFPCCYWEYARESARIRAFFLRVDSGFFPGPPTLPEIRALDGSLFQKAHRSPIDSERMRFGEQIRLYAEPLRLAMQRVREAGLVSEALDLPWSKLPQTARSHVVSDIAPYFAKHPWLTFLPFNRCSDMRDLGIATDDYRCAKLDPETGIEYLRVEIDWATFTDAQIERAFHVWIRENRPKGVGRKSERGHRRGPGLENQLKWTAMLRLLNACRPSDMARKYPEATTLYGKADWPRARKNANRALHKWYPFLPVLDRPIHWRTSAGRGK